jgi:hypothetical protein
MNMEDVDLRRFKALKMRFDILAKELHDNHQEWKRIHEGPRDTYHELRHNELITHESEVLEEVRRLLSSAGELVCHNLERPR